MSTLNSACENYHLTHGNFVEAYKMVNDYVTELYKLPKQFLDETEGTMNLLTSTHFAPKSPSAKDKSMRIVVDFMDQLDEFTMHTINLFNDHMKHIDETQVYLNKIKAIESKLKGKGTPEVAQEYTSLTPKVNELMEGLKQIKVRADETLSWLEKLEVKWEDVQVKIKLAA